MKIQVKCFSCGSPELMLDYGRSELVCMECGRRNKLGRVAEKNLALAFSEIACMASHLSIPRNVRELATMIYQKAMGRRLIRGRSVEGVAAAALYAACKEFKIPRTLVEIADVSRVSKKEIGRTHRHMLRLGIVRSAPTSPMDLIPRFSSELALSGETQSKAVELLQEAQMKGLARSGSPPAVAAGAIYIASVLMGERRGEREVADVARVTEVSVRNWHKKLYNELDISGLLHSNVLLTATVGGIQIAKATRVPSRNPLQRVQGSGS